MRTTEATRHTYGMHRVQEDPRRCVKTVYREGRGGQCSHKRGHGVDGAYCKLHDPARVQEKRAARSAARDAEWTRKAAVCDAGEALLWSLGVEGHADSNGYLHISQDAARALLARMADRGDAATKER